MRRTAIRLSLVITLLASIASTASPALAEESAFARDPDDTPGKLDLDAIGIVAKNSGTMFVGVRTFAAWRDRDLDDDGENRIIFSLNLDDDRRAEYVGRISNVGGELLMTLSGDRDLDPLPVTRVDATTIRVRLPARSPLSQPDLRFYAKTRLVGSGDCSNACVDRAPDRSALGL